MATKKKNKGGRPRIFKTSKELRDAFVEYVEHQTDKGRPVTKMSFLAHIMVNCNYTGDLPDEFSGTIKRINTAIQAFAEERLYTQKNVAGIIFSLVNNYNWTNNRNDNKTEHSGEVTAKVVSLPPLNE